MIYVYVHDREKEKKIQLREIPSCLMPSTKIVFTQQLLKRFSDR